MTIELQHFSAETKRFGLRAGFRPPFSGLIFPDCSDLRFALGLWIHGMACFWSPTEADLVRVHPNITQTSPKHGEAGI